MTRGRGGAARAEILGRCRGELYGGRQDYAAMMQTAEEMVDGAGARVHALVLRSGDLEGAVADWTPARYEVEAKRLGGKTALCVARRADALLSRAGPVRVAAARMPGVPGHYCAVSDCRLSEFRGVFMEFIRRHLPDISLLYLTNGDIEGALGAIDPAGRGVHVTYVAAKGRRRAAGVLESHAKSTRTPPAGLFAELCRGSRAATTVRYAAAAPPLPGGRGPDAAPRGTVARDCCFSAAAGAGALFGAAIPRAIALSLERNLFMEASAESASSGETEPTVIRFGRRTFLDRGRNVRFVDAMAEMPDTSISKYAMTSHVHLSMVDYTDCSSYDLWAPSIDKLVIIPQIRASGASLRRIVNYVFERIGEGRVEAHPYP